MKTNSNALLPDDASSVMLLIANLLECNGREIEHLLTNIADEDVSTPDDLARGMI